MESENNEERQVGTLDDIVRLLELSDETEGEEGIEMVFADGDTATRICLPILKAAQARLRELDHVPAAAPETFRLDAGVRYCEDATVNDEDESDSAPRMPFLVKDGYEWRWRLEIDIATGTVLNWPSGVRARTFYKVCDECAIEFNGKKYDDYVPSFLEIDDNGYGDYIYVTIGPDGKIKDWDADECRAFLNDATKFV